MDYDADDRERFWSKVDRGDADECWPWTSYRTTSGHGQFWLDGRPRNAHRVAYALEHGRAPAGRVVHADCDTLHCVNPAHLRDTGDGASQPVATDGGATDAE